MVRDLTMIQDFYSLYTHRVGRVRDCLNRPLTLSEKVLYSHLTDISKLVNAPARGHAYASFLPNRVAMQDATAQMAILQFMNTKLKKSVVPTTVHCDHLICAYKGEKEDLCNACLNNSEVYEFLKSASSKFGFGFWPAGAGIIHQIVLENYAFPGGMMVGTDSHTPNAGGLGMLAIGVGGADAVDVMAGMDWELKVPQIIGVKLSGKLNGWASPKDIILKLAGILTTKGGTNAIIEYFGDGANTLSCTGKATICNMGAEVGATSSIFAYDDEMHDYLVATGREVVANCAEKCKLDLRPDDEVLASPHLFYDKVIEIDLDHLVPYVNGPFSPDLSMSIDKVPSIVCKKKYPSRIDAVLIGSCTNSSYQDLSRAASVVEKALSIGLVPKTQFIVNPGSKQIKDTAERDGILESFRKAGAIIMANACGPCIGQWKRQHNNEANSIITTFNRNFAKRADGNPNTHAFIASPEIAAAYVFTGNLLSNPCDIIPDPQGEKFPPSGFVNNLSGLIEEFSPYTDIVIPNDSNRLQFLKPFEKWDQKNIKGVRLLMKVKGKCTTDHISMAGPWLKYRGHLENISQNLLLGAKNAFTDECGTVYLETIKSYVSVAEAAKTLKLAGYSTFIVAEENYGEGSSREHAAMEPRFLGVRFVLAKSFARIHETNLKKQGILAVTFCEPNDYDLIREGDVASINMDSFSEGSQLEICIEHADGNCDIIRANHSYNKMQIEWFKEGSAINFISRNICQ